MVPIWLRLTGKGSSPRSLPQAISQGPSERGRVKEGEGDSHLHYIVGRGKWREKGERGKERTEGTRKEVGEG